ncbi:MULTISPECIES: nitroreductase family protein [Clostridium]|uniref:nitroreductase family protein n=1 Tax=Clostridium TaxID=1485 RepID=UPI000826451E|nr:MULTISPECIES: nitroreductase family protein [Clostridium]PJI10314.1 nitroreductase family protein [Clostridium sp. CT7]
MIDFKKLVEERRSANNFIEGIEIPKSDFIEIFELVKLVPSCFNIQHTNYFVVTDKDKKEELRKAAFNQYKVHTASAAILVLGDKEAYKNANKLYSGMVDLKMISQFDYEKILNDIKNLYEGRGEEFKHDEAIRNSSISAMMFMLAAKYKGWDTCPMIGFDAKKMHEVFNIPERYEISMLITMGKEDTKNKRLRGYRKPIGEFVKFNDFQ